MLASALFMSDPSAEPAHGLAGAAYNPSTVFKLKQNLWHAGVILTKAHPSAGSMGAEYLPERDEWSLEVGTRAVGS